jgi:hypothetical protein
MRILLRAIAKATHDGRSAARRSRVLDELFHLRETAGALGAFSVARDGATTLMRYTIYLVRGGVLVPWYTASASSG